MTTRELVDLLLLEPPDDEVGIAYEGVFTTVIHLTEVIAFANDPDKRERTLLIEAIA